MAAPMKRRLLIILFVALFAISGVAHVYASTTANMSISMAADVSAQWDDMGCCDDGKVAHAPCVAMCANSAAILSEIAAVVPIMRTHAVESVAQQGDAGLEPAPEPHPPKRLA